LLNLAPTLLEIMVCIPQLVTATVLHQQMPANDIRHTRTLLEVLVPRYRAASRKLGPCKESADLLQS